MRINSSLKVSRTVPFFPSFVTTRPVLVFMTLFFSSQFVPCSLHHTPCLIPYPPFSLLFLFPLLILFLSSFSSPHPRIPLVSLMFPSPFTPQSVSFRGTHVQHPQPPHLGRREARTRSPAQGDTSHEPHEEDADGRQHAHDRCHL